MPQSSALAFYLLLGLISASPVEVQLSEDEMPKEEICHMCHEIKKGGPVQVNGLSEMEFEDDRKDVKAALSDIEKNLSEIDKKIWWLPKSDISRVHNESEVVRDGVVKKSMSVEDVEMKTGAIRNKLEVYEAEKETNKAKAVEHWGMLFRIRRRLYNLEKVLLDVVVLAEDLATVAHMDKLRVFANTVAEKVKKVMDYYENNTATVQAINSTLREVDAKKSELKPPSAAAKKKCAFWFFFCRNE